MTTAADPVATSRKAGKWVVAALAGVTLGLAFYVASFFMFRWMKPAALMTINGPVAVYRGLYLPLRAVTAGHHGLMQHWWEADGRRRARFDFSHYHPDDPRVYVAMDGVRVGWLEWSGPDSQLQPGVARAGMATVSWSSVLVYDNHFHDRWAATMTNIEWE